MSAPERDELVDHLVRHRIAGDVRTPRESNLRNIQRMLDGDPQYTFGLELAPHWTAAAVLDVLAKRVGIDPDPRRRYGADRIDAHRTVEQLDAMRARLTTAMQRRERVLFATGHPTGVLAIHLGLASAVADAGGSVLSAGAGRSYERHYAETVRREVRYLGGVAMVTDGASFRHTHAPEGMWLILDALAEAGEPAPDLVVADHGWAGAAGQAGVDAVGFADSNDPALFVGQAEGKLSVVVPLDDNVWPQLYDPVTRYLVSR